MKKKQVYCTLITGLLYGIFGTSMVWAQAPSSKPNMIFILMDDLGSGDIGAFFQNSRKAGQPRLYTPVLDRMAAEGAMLMQHYCAAPVCAPSRASILLGKSQGHANVRNNQFDKALEDNHTMAGVLRYAGYKTAAIGKWGLQGRLKGNTDWPAHPLKRGFDYYYGYMRHADGHEHYPREGPHKGPKEVWENYREVSDGLDKCYTGDLFTAVAKKYIIDHQRGTDADKPFFMYLAYDTPHARLQLPTQSYPEGGGLKGGMQWLGKPGKMINTASGTIDSYVYPEYARATYDHDNDPSTPEIDWPDTYKRFASVNKRIDEQIGDILQLLRDLKIDRNTLVVFTSDNGPSKESYLPEDQFVAYEADFFNSFAVFDGIKRDLYEGGLRTSTIAWWPGAIRAGTVVETPNVSYDWLPTFTDVAGVPAPAGVDGVSLLPSLIGKGAQATSLIYSEYVHQAKMPTYPAFIPERRGKERGQMQMIRLGDFTGVRYQIRSADDDFEIYDVRKDPQQVHNIATQYPDLQREMKARVLQVRLPDTAAARPYDETMIPAVEVEGLQPGLTRYEWHSRTPWIPEKDKDLSASAIISSLRADTRLASGNNTICYQGYIQVPADGVYTFYLDAGASPALLSIHDISAIDAYAGGRQEVMLRLRAGIHPFSFSFLNKEGVSTSAVSLQWRIPGGSRTDIPAANFLTSRQRQE